MPGGCAVGTHSAAWRSVETLLCKELGACGYERALLAALPASTQSHLLQKWSLYRPSAASVRRELEAAYKACHGAESIPEDIATLAEKNNAAAAAPGGAGTCTLSSDVWEQLPFAARLLVLWHARRPEQIPELVRMILTTTQSSTTAACDGNLEHAESIVRARCESTRRCIAEPLAGKHRVVLQVDFQAQSTLVRLSDVSKLPATTFADACLGSGRLVKVKLPKPKFGRGATGKKSAHDSYIQLARHGFKFAGEQFDAFGSKDAHSLAWYFVRQDVDAPVPSAAALRDVMGDWRALPSASTLACRLELALGGVVLGPKLCDSQIEVIEDIVSARPGGGGGDGAMLTDGSGFISPDLAELIAPRISQGQAAHHDEGDKPAAFQIRLVCRLGCFKGTLVVHHGLHSKVQLRRSMLKIPPLTDGAGELEDTVFRQLDGYNRLLVVNTSREVRSDAELNRHLLLMLTACAGDEKRRAQLVSYFRELLRGAVQRLIDVMHDRSAAYKYCAAAACHLGSDASGMGLATAMEMLLAGHALDQPYVASVLHKHLQADWDRLHALRIECPGSGYLMGVPDPTGSLRRDEVYVRPLSSQAAFVGQVVVARFPLVSASSVREFQAVDSPQIEECLGGRAGVIVFSCAGSSVGEGDDEDEAPVACMGGDYDGDLYYVNWNLHVTACLGGAADGRRPSEDNDDDNDNDNGEEDDEEGEVPMQPSSQQSPILAVADDGQSTAEDFDAEATTVGVPLVQPVVDVAVAFASSRKQASGGVAVPFSSVCLRQLLSAPVRKIPGSMVSAVLMHEWLDFLRTDVMGLSATQWLVHADRHGVHHPTTVAWARLHLRSLQARKHAVSVDRGSLPPQSERYPDFMGKPASVSYPSTSILGEMHSVVRDHAPVLALDFGSDFTLDEDLFHPKARNYVQALNAWVTDYAQALSAIMADTDDEAERYARIEDVMARFERLRDDLIRDESRRRQTSTAEVEEAVASALYEVCSLRFRDMLDRTRGGSTDRRSDIASFFSPPAPPRKPPVHYLRFCWRLCGRALNRLKIRAQSRSVQSVADTLLSLRLPHGESAHTAAVQAESDLVSVSRRELLLLIQALQQQQQQRR